MNCLYIYSLQCLLFYCFLQFVYNVLFTNIVTNTPGASNDVHISREKHVLRLFGHFGVLKYLPFFGSCLSAFTIYKKKFIASKPVRSVFARLKDLIMEVFVCAWRRDKIFYNCTKFSNIKDFHLIFFLINHSLC